MLPRHHLGISWTRLNLKGLECAEVNGREVWMGSVSWGGGRKLLDKCGKKTNLLPLLLHYFRYKISLFESRKNLLCGKSPTIHIRANITLSLPLLLLCCPGWFGVSNLQKWSWEHDVCESLFLTPNYRPSSLYLFLKKKLLQLSAPHQLLFVFCLLHIQIQILWSFHLLKDICFF